eukprot:1087363-Pelagomonas_calceolata.AAC.1
MPQVPLHHEWVLRQEVLRQGMVDQDTPTGNTAAEDAGTGSPPGGCASERAGSAVRSSTDGGK